MSLHAFQTFNRHKTCRYGEMLYNINDTHVGRALDLYGEFAESEVEVFRQLIKPGYTVVEVGANIGAHTVFFARQVGPTGLVVAFEPQRLLFQTLCANLALNSVPNVLCFHRAAGTTHGSIDVPPLDPTAKNDFANVSLGDSPQGEQVPLVPLDAYALPQCNFIKIDVQGMEEDVVRGTAKLIERFKPILYVDNDRKGKSESLIRHIHELGYKMYWHTPAYYNPQNFLGNSENAFSGAVSRNMVCVHSEVSQSFSGMEVVKVPGA